MRNGTPALLVGLALTALSVARLGWSVSTGSPDIWNIVGYDQGGGLAAFRYFLDGPWSWNPLMISSIGDGVAITLTDSNALLALVAKVLRPLGIEPTTWFALWVALLPAATGMAAATAVRAFRPSAHLAAISAGLTLGLAPFMLFRVFHPALAFHAPILLGIAGIGWMRRTESPRRLVAVLAVLPVLAFLTHPYLGPMSALTAGAAIITGLRVGRTTFPAALGWATSVLGGWAIVLIASQVPNRSVVPSQAGPIYGANIMNPLTPQFSDLWPGGQLFGPRTSWEGLSWVGIGGALIVLAALAAMMVRAMAALRV